MKIQEAYNFIESLKNEITNTSEIKVYKNFLDILTKLKSKEFSKDEIQSIETELDSLTFESNPESKKIYFNKQLKEFKGYLKEKHSLISAGYYTNVGITTGAALGIVVGVIIGERFEKSLGIAVGIGIGMLIGFFVGRNKDSQAKAIGKVL